MSSPTTASLGTHETIPVSHFTGKPNINIPIHTISQDGIGVPIGLSYDASGVRPDQHPGWVGMNWSLNAGGVITRSVKDLPDEYVISNTLYTYLNHVYLGYPSNDPQLVSIYNSLDNPSTQSGYYFTHNVTNHVDWDDEDFIEKIADNKWGRVFDTEPDIFNFSFLGYSGSFFLSETGTWEVQSDQNIKVVFDENNFQDLPAALQTSTTQHPLVHCLKAEHNMQTFGGFILITEDGVQYHFGYTAATPTTDATEYSVSFFEQIQELWQANSWHLTKITAPNGRSIDFTYEPDDYISNLQLSFTWKREYIEHITGSSLCHFQRDEPGQASLLFGLDGTIDAVYPKFTPYTGMLIRPVYLSKIETANEEVLFDRSTSNELTYPDSYYLGNVGMHQYIIDHNHKGGQDHGAACYAGATGPEKDIAWPFLYAVNPSTSHADLLDELKWKKLDNIRVRSKLDVNKGFQMGFTYQEVSTERLKLLSIQKSDLSSALSEPSYVFEYFDGVLPGYLTEQVDHWGFFNGNTSTYVTNTWTFAFLDNPYSVLQPALNNPIYFNSREASTNLATALSGTLKKITYPLGGFTEFEYEQHQYRQCLNDDRISLETFGSNQTAGGLRLKKVTTNADSPSSPPIEKEYFYVSGYTAGANPSSLTSSGIRSGKEVYQ